MFLAGQNVSRDAGDGCKRVPAPVPLTNVFAPRILRRDLWVNFVQVALDDRDERALALCARKTKDMTAGTIAPVTSPFLVLPVSIGARVTEVIIRSMGVGLSDVHTRHIVGYRTSVGS